MDEIEKTGFSMTMLDVGQGLALLIEADGHYMLYDGGGQSRSSYVVSYLRQHGVTELDYMVASHYDEDHISGLIGVMNTACSCRRTMHVTRIFSIPSVPQSRTSRFRNSILCREKDTH